MIPVPGQPSPDRILNAGLGFFLSKTLLTAVDLGLFTKLAKSPLAYEELRTQTGLHPRSARDFFDALVAAGFLERTGDVYSNTSETDLYLDRAKPTYLGGMLEMANARLYGFWNNLRKGLETGEPQNEIQKGGNLFETLYADPQLLRGFLAGMTGLSLAAGQAIAAKFPFAQFRTFADVGCAQGGVTGQIALAHSHLTGTGFDVPPVQPIFEEYMADLGLANRVRFQAGDFMTGPLPQADVLVMGHILHDWGLQTKKMLLAKAFDALPAGGALILHEAVIDDDRRQNVFGLLMSLNMLIETPDGFDYTGADGCRWMRETGFSKTYVEPLAGPDSMIVGIK